MRVDSTTFMDADDLCFATVLITAVKVILGPLNPSPGLDPRRLISLAAPGRRTVMQ